MRGKITPFLWFDGKAEEAANFYVSVFKKSRIVRTTHYRQNMPLAAGTVLTVEFELDGEPFIALNGGESHPFTTAVSFSIDCATQDEVDLFWDKLSDGGRTSQCGWLEDKYGLSWQVVPSFMPAYISDPNERKSDAVLQAMMTMTKLDISALQAAYDSA